MEFVAKLDDQISEPAAAAASAQEGLAQATKAADAQLRALDSTQQKAARRAELSAKAFNPKAYQQQVLAERQLAAAKDAALQKLGLGLSQKEKDEAAAAKAAEAERKKQFDPKVYQQQVLAERDLAAAKEKALQQLGRGLSQKEKDEAASKKSAEEESKRSKKKSAEERERAREAAAQRAKGLALAVGATMGVSGGLGLAKIAIGYQGMARLQMISYQASLQMRSLFRGVDSRPLERAYLQFTKLFSLSTTTGKGISSLMTRGFNAFFQAIEKAEPYVSGFVRGAYGGVLDLEYAWLQARVALLPLTDAIDDASGGLSGLEVASAAGAAGVAVLTGYAVVAAAPFIALAAAIGAVVAAADQLAALRREWDGDLILRSLGIGESDADRMNRQFDEEAAARRRAGKKSLVREVDRLPVDNALVDGRKTGVAMGAGIVTGLKSKEAEVAAAGGALAMAADRGVRTAADIHSPSRLMRRTTQHIGEGARLGLKDKEKDVQEQAAVSLVPSPRAAAAAGSGGASGAPGGVTLYFTGDINVGAGLDRQEVRESFDEAMAAMLQQVGVMLGAPRAEVSSAG
ncbi:hypothetical protein WME98_49985 [Sorangium sp. So ce296]|uniref:hypothetical protein n=1 Tax=Sorangium sp. So ce296 TaxID=3133296 RepID=UPI003F601C6C